MLEFVSLLRGALFHRRGRARWVTSLLRALVFALALPLATAGALPLWAQLAGVEGPHVCHCSIEKHDCICPKCNPDHDHDAMFLLSSESLKGRCGDDDIAFGGKAICAVLPAPTNTAAPLAETTLAFLPVLKPLALSLPPPPTPPPRFLSETV